MTTRYLPMLLIGLSLLLGAKTVHAATDLSANPSFILDVSGDNGCQEVAKDVR